MSPRLISLRLSDHCVACSREIPVWMDAWYDVDAKSVTCVDCQRRTETASRPVAVPPPWPPPVVPDAVGGQARRDARAARTWRRLAPAVEFVTDEPHRRAVDLGRELAGEAIVLHGREILATKGGIDDVVIASSGVWVVDAKNYSGTVERRDVGTWRLVDHRLFVNGRDRTKLVDALKRQSTVIQTSVLAAGFDPSLVHPTLLFTNSQWPWFARPIELHGVQVMWPTKLCELIRQPGPLAPPDIEALVTRLTQAPGNVPNDLLVRATSRWAPPLT
jgi:hypothetical protein